MIAWVLAALAGCGGDCPAPDDADLVIEQIHVRGPFTGESTLIVGPDGTSVLIDVGNDACTRCRWAWTPTTTRMPAAWPGWFGTGRFPRTG